MISVRVVGPIRSQIESESLSGLRSLTTSKHSALFTSSSYHLRHRLRLYLYLFGTFLSAPFQNLSWCLALGVAASPPPLKLANVASVLDLPPPDWLGAKSVGGDCSMLSVATLTGFDAGPSGTDGVSVSEPPVLAWCRASRSASSSAREGNALDLGGESVARAEIGATGAGVEELSFLGRFKGGLSSPLS